MISLYRWVTALQRKHQLKKEQKHEETVTAPVQVKDHLLRIHAKENFYTGTESAPDNITQGALL
ncbi:hypothetical protein KDW_49510 [Dictyobacter vulcani]|uniref:Uncharacterized protein n=1 Tax=Dictyobacter vulcani TaxID=2607529 RepID=A0A5J4KXE4_9CHLR|nr:hypothetical protein KDW_49510 [Dictyobacter vulcani]